MASAGWPATGSNAASMEIGGIPAVFLLPKVEWFIFVLPFKSIFLKASDEGQGISVQFASSRSV